MKNIYLLPNKSKIVGFVLLILGLALTYIRFSIGIKPEFLNQKVFSVYSSFLEKSYFTFTTNNIFEEICGLLGLFGLSIIAFSKEKIENEKVQEIRLYSFLYAVYANILLILFAFIFIYGLGFVSFALLNMYLILVLYIIIFRYQIFKNLS